MLKFPKLFFQSALATDAFERRIHPDVEQRSHLTSCVTKIRNYLKPHITLATTTVLGMEESVTPRFRTQGSWSYDTCVVPAAMPPQEMDWDYGIYLPVTIWEENGPPHAMAKAYFALVERLLKDLCDKEKWTLLPGKDTCIRIQVSNWAHIDLPLYAAPLEEFESIRDSVALAKSYAYDSVSMEDAHFAEAFDAQEWEDLNTIVMATRKGEWVVSDPEAVANWFKDRVEEHGPQLRRVCRYLKAWRDFNWRDGGPSSVAIMIAATQGFEPYAGRDDRALEEAAKRLGHAFLTDIREVGIDDGADNFNRLNSTERVIAAQRFQKLSSQLFHARQAGIHEKETVIQKLREQFGPRISSNIACIEPDSHLDFIRNTPATKVAPPVVPSTKAG
jgi:hypothetical protein